MCGKIEKLSDWSENWCCSIYGPCDYDSRLEPSCQYSCSCSSFSIVAKRKKGKKGKRQIKTKNTTKIIQQKRQNRQKNTTKKEKDNNNKQTKRQKKQQQQKSQKKATKKDKQKQTNKQKIIIGQNKLNKPHMAGGLKGPHTVCRS